MVTKISVILFILTIIVFCSFITKKNENKSFQYALLYETHLGLGLNKLEVIYDTGEQEDLIKKLNIKLSGSWNANENFQKEVLSFKYLNEKGYNFVSQSYDSKNGTNSFVFIKSN